MLDKPHLPQRARLSARAEDVLAVLPAIGRLMVTSNQHGATHERIGTVETVRFTEGWATLYGAEHDSRICLADIAELVVDRTSVMKDKAYPRIEFRRADGTEIMHVVGFDGLAPFDTAISEFGPGEALDVPERPDPGPRGDVAPDDVGQSLFEAALAAARPVTVAFDKPGFHQAWHGTIEAVKPAMGFVNLMRPDFHLHLRAGAVAVWRPLPTDTGTRYEALGPDGVAPGLSLFVPGAPLNLSRPDA